MLTVLDLFSGIGGFSLGLESTGGFRTVAFCEIEPFPRAVLRKHWPDVPIHEDVRELRGETVGPVDMICGGFPCQDVSVAGKGAGIDGARSGLWSEFSRLVGELGPTWVLAENVGALRTRGVDRVCSDLEREGYAVWPLLVGAWAVGAPHKRERVWIVAHRTSERRSGGTNAGREGAASLTLGTVWGEPSRSGALDDSDAGRRGREDGQVQAGRDEPERTDGPRWPARPGEPQHEWEPARLAQFGVGGDPHELRPRLVRAAERRARRANREALKAYGNSVVPAVVATIGRAILAAEGVSK